MSAAIVERLLIEQQAVALKLRELDLPAPQPWAEFFQGLRPPKEWTRYTYISLRCILAREEFASLATLTLAIC